MTSIREWVKKTVPEAYRRNAGVIQTMAYVFAGAMGIEAHLVDDENSLDLLVKRLPMYGYANVMQMYDSYKTAVNPPATEKEYLLPLLFDWFEKATTRKQAEQAHGMLPQHPRPPSFVKQELHSSESLTSGTASASSAASAIERKRLLNKEAQKKSTQNRLDSFLALAKTNKDKGVVTYIGELSEKIGKPKSFVGEKRPLSFLTKPMFWKERNDDIASISKKDLLTAIEAHYASVGKGEKKASTGTDHKSTKKYVNILRLASILSSSML